MSDSFDLKVGPDSVGLSVTGDASRSLSEALRDTVSPFTEALGWAGDQISIARKAAALRAAKKASETLMREGISTAKIPPKILLPWLDGASLEDEKTPNLTDAWAGIFVRAAKSPDAVINSYIDVIKKLGAKEANIITAMSGGFESKDFDYLFNRERMTYSGNEELERVRSWVTSDGTTNSQKEDAFESMFTKTIRFIFYKLGDNPKKKTKFFQENEVAIANLEHLNLIFVETGSFIYNSGRVCSFVYITPTRFAVDLSLACRGAVS